MNEDVCVSTTIVLKCGVKMSMRRYVSIAGVAAVAREEGEGALHAERAVRQREIASALVHHAHAIARRGIDVVDERVEGDGGSAVEAVFESGELHGEAQVVSGAGVDLVLLFGSGERLQDDEEPARWRRSRMRRGLAMKQIMGLYRGGEQE
jgi:hypothetical protein